MDPTRRTFFDADGRAPVHPAGRQAFEAALAEGWADPRRLHSEGRRARLLLDSAREVLAEAIGCRPQEVHLAPSHPAALHAAVLAVAHARRRTGTGVVLSAVERAAVHAAARHVAPEAPRLVPVDRTGRVDLGAWAEAVQGTGVVVAALQHANGEVGTLQPVAEAHEVAVRASVPLLMDAGASLGHASIEPTWDLLAADPGSWGAPPGVAALAVRSKVRAVPAWPEDPDAWFPGGVSIPAAFGAAAALQAVLAERATTEARRHALVSTVRERVAREIPDVEVVGDPVARLPHIVTFSCLYVDGEALLAELDRRGFAVGSGSACTSDALEPSHVLAAMGVLTHGNIRLTLPYDATRTEVNAFCDQLRDAVADVRAVIGAREL